MRFHQTYMPSMEFGPNPELHVRHDMWVKLCIQTGHVEKKVMPVSLIYSFLGNVLFLSRSVQTLSRGRGGGVGGQAGLEPPRTCKS